MRHPQFLVVRVHLVARLEALLVLLLAEVHGVAGPESEMLSSLSRETEIGITS